MQAKELPELPGGWTWEKLDRLLAVALELCAETEIPLPEFAAMLKQVRPEDIEEKRDV